MAVGGRNLVVLSNVPVDGGARRRALRSDGVSRGGEVLGVARWRGQGR